jgi:hypothetical protein
MIIHDGILCCLCSKPATSIIIQTTGVRDYVETYTSPVCGDHEHHELPIEDNVSSREKYTIDEFNIRAMLLS